MRFRRPEVLWGLLAVAVFGLGIWWLPGSDRIDTDSYAVGFGGKRVFYELLERLEPEVYRSTDELAPFDAPFSRLLILGPARYPSDGEWDVIRENVFDYEVSVVFAANRTDPSTQLKPFDVDVRPFSLDEWDDVKAASPGAPTGSTSDVDAGESNGNASDTGAADDSGTQKNESVDAPEPSVLEAEQEEVDDADALTGDIVGINEAYAVTDLVDGLVKWRTRAFLDPPDDSWETLVSVKGKPQVIRKSFGNATVVLVATDDPFSNSAMLEPKRAQLAYRIVQAATVDYAVNCYDEFLNSSGPPKVVGILFDPVLRPLTLQFVLIAVLFGWAGSYRFGPVRNQRDIRRRSIEEHAEAIGVMHYQLKAGEHSVASMHDFLTQELIRNGGPPANYVHAETIAQMTRRDPVEVESVLLAADSMRRTTPKRADAARLVRRLSDLVDALKTRSAGDSNPVVDS